MEVTIMRVEIASSDEQVHPQRRIAAQQISNGELPAPRSCRPQHDLLSLKRLPSPAAKRSSAPSSLPVPRDDKSTNKVTSRSASSTQPGTHATVIVNTGAGMHINQVPRLNEARIMVIKAGVEALPRLRNGDNVDDATACHARGSITVPTSQDSIDHVPNSDSTVLAPGASLHHQQRILKNQQADERSDKPRSNTSPATNNSSDSDETARISTDHKLTDNQSQHHGDPDSGVVELSGSEEEKTPGARWFLGTAAALHATGDPRQLSALKLGKTGRSSVQAADGMPLPVLGCGNVKTDNLDIHDVYLVSGICMNIVSVGQLAQLGYSIGFGRRACVVSSPAGEVVGKAHAGEDGMYEVEFLKVPPPGSSSSSAPS